MRALSAGPRCQACLGAGWPDFFSSEPRCAFSTGEFSPDNWACATALLLRKVMGECGFDIREEARNYRLSMYVREDDRSWGAAYVPPHPHDPEDVGFWRGGGLIAGHWYKGDGQTENLIRVDGRNCGLDHGRPLLLVEAEVALQNLRAVGVRI